MNLQFLTKNIILQNLITDEELERERKRRENVNRLNLIKRYLFNLREIPQFYQIVKDNEEIIRKFENIREIRMSDFYNEMRKINFYERLINEIFCVLDDERNWIYYDNFTYQKCKTCNNFEVSFYKNGKIKEIFLSFSGGARTIYRSSYINSKCTDCREIDISCLNLEF